MIAARDLAGAVSGKCRCGELAMDKGVLWLLRIPLTPKIQSPCLHVCRFGGLAGPAIENGKRSVEPGHPGRIPQVSETNIGALIRRQLKFTLSPTVQEPQR